MLKLKAGWFKPFKISLINRLHGSKHFIKYNFWKSRCRGYIEFYLDTKNLRRTPFYMVSIGNAVLLLTVTALHDYCDHETNNCPDKFTKVAQGFKSVSWQCMLSA